MELRGLEPLTPALPATGTSPEQAGFPAIRRVVDVAVAATVVTVVVEFVVRSAVTNDEPAMLEGPVTNQTPR